ncbi:MAG: hypothetical protein WCG85_01515 [Polyangia bacterium]
MRGTVGPLWLAWFVAAVLAGGCSFFDQVGSGNLSFALPINRAFEIATADSRWWPSPALGVPDVICSGPAALVSDCCQPPEPMTAVDCQEYPLSCDPADGYCALAFDYDDAVEIDLGSDVPALKDHPNRVLAQATLAPIETTVTSGVGTLPLRTASLYAAPQGTTSAQAAGATFLADVPLGSEKGQRAYLAAQAEIGLSPFLTDFNTPFVLILSARVVVKSGAAPKGVETIKVGGTVDASF